MKISLYWLRYYIYIISNDTNTNEIFFFFFLRPNHSRKSSRQMRRTESRRPTIIRQRERRLRSESFGDRINGQKLGTPSHSHDRRSRQEDYYRWWENRWWLSATWKQRRHIESTSSTPRRTTELHAIVPQL